MTQPTVAQSDELSAPDDSVVEETLDAAEVSDPSEGDEAQDSDEDHDANDEPNNQSAPRPVAVKLPDEPYDFNKCVVTVTLGFLPGDANSDERRVIAMIDSHGEAPTKTMPLRLLQMQPLPAWLQELFAAHAAALPAREAAAKARKDEEAKREAERQTRLARSSNRNTSTAKRTKKGRLADVGEAQDVLFGGEPVTVAVPAQPEPPADAVPSVVETPPAPPVPTTPQITPALTLGPVTAPPAKRPSKTQTALEESESLQDVLFG